MWENQRRRAISLAAALSTAYKEERRTLGRTTRR